MDKLPFSPQRSSYTPRLGNDIRTTSYVSGLPRQRQVSQGAPHTSPVTFILKTPDFNEFMDFYYTYRALPFLVELFAIDGALRWYECRFLDAPNHRQLAFNLYEVSTNLVISSLPATGVDDDV